jgi:hypothetical protein
VSHSRDCRERATMEDRVIESGADNAINIHFSHEGVIGRIGSATIAIRQRLFATTPSARMLQPTTGSHDNVQESI